MHTYNNIQHTVKGISKYRYLHMLYSLHPLDTVHYICMPTDIIQLTVTYKLLTKLPSNVIIDKFDITKKSIPNKLGFFFRSDQDKISLNLIIAVQKMWEFISGIKPPQKRKTDEDQISYCHKYLRNLYYLNKLVFKMNTYSFLSECNHFSLTSTEKSQASKNVAGHQKLKVSVIPEIGHACYQ